METLKNKVAGSENLRAKIPELDNKCEFLLNELQISAKSISLKRNKTIPTIEGQLVNLLKKVGIKEPTVSLRNTTLLQISENGIDKIEMLFSANKGINPGLVSETASGGELSRIMLALKYLLSDHINLPTVIFDEIDTGISGEVAVQVGKMIKTLSSRHQVMAITHLPQVAAMGNHQFFVYKETDHEISQTKIRELIPAERIQSIAMMIGGNSPSAAAYESAKELLQL